MLLKVSEFAPRRCQKFLSYLTGRCNGLLDPHIKRLNQAAQVGCQPYPGRLVTLQVLSSKAVSLLFHVIVVMTLRALYVDLRHIAIIQALITVNNPNYEGTGWQGTLFIFAFTVPMWLGNTVFSSGLPTFNSIIMILHVSGFIVIIGVLWGLAPHNSAEDVFTHFTNGGGWSSNPLAIMVGQISAIWALICSDSAVHMGEETSSASLTVPRSMFYAYLSNGLIAFVFLITYLFAIPSVTDAVNDPSGYPFLYVLQHTFPDKVAGTNVITTIMLVLNLAASIVFNASTARQMFAFARDKGLPFSNWIAHVHPTWKIPVHAVTLTCATACLLGLINIGSSAAFNAIISLNLTSLLLTYILAIASVMYRRIVTPHLIPPARWSLGRYAVVVNGVALVYSVFAFFWCFWPNVVDPDPEDFNWAVAIFAAVFVWAVAMYFFRGRKVYDGPVTLVKAAPEAEVVFETKNKSEADVIPEEKNENFGIASFDVGHS